MPRTPLAQTTSPVRPCAENVRRHLKEAGRDTSLIRKITTGRRECTVNLHNATEEQVAEIAHSLRALWQDGFQRVANYGTWISIAVQGYWDTVPAASYVRPTESWGHPVLARVYEVLAEREIDIAHLDFRAEGDYVVVRHRVDRRAATELETVLRDAGLRTLTYTGTFNVMFARPSTPEAAWDEAHAQDAECSTIGCHRTATRRVLWSAPRRRDDVFEDAVCIECGKSYFNRPSLHASVLPLSAPAEVWDEAHAEEALRASRVTAPTFYRITLLGSLIGEATTLELAHAQAEDLSRHSFPRRLVRVHDVDGETVLAEYRDGLLQPLETVSL